MYISVDGSHMLRRILYAAPEESPLMYSFMFVRTLVKACEKFENVEGVYMLWDIKTSNNRRQQIYPEYKAEREPPPDSFWYAKELLYEELPKLGICNIAIPNCEADDLARLVTKKHPEGGVHITEDKDWYLNMTETWSLYKPIKDIMITWDDLCSELETKKPIVKYMWMKCMIGKKGEVEGVKGVGPKFALKFAECLMTGKDLGKGAKAEAVKGNLKQIQFNMRICDLSWIEKDDTIAKMFDLQTSPSRITIPTVIQWASFCNRIKSERLPTWWDRWKRVVSNFKMEG